MDQDAVVKAELVDTVEDSSSQDSQHNSTITEQPVTEGETNAVYLLMPEVKLEPEDVPEEPNGGEDDVNDTLGSNVDDEEEEVAETPVACTCPHCGITLANPGLVRGHVTMKHPGKKPFGCRDCKRFYHGYIAFDRHLKTHKSQVVVPHCPICKKTFTTKYQIKHHLRLHTGERPFQCSVCEKAFTQASNMRAHMLRHTDNKKYKCTECDLSFYEPINLRRHQVSHSSDRSHQCHECGKVFKRPRALVNHLKTHATEKNFTCKACGKVFAVAKYLKTHMARHVKDSSFSCRHCGKTFRYKSKLARHIGIHFNKKAFCCAECNDTFKSRRRLIAHLSTHNGGEDDEYIADT